MSNLIERPSFYEGQILGAADLEAGVVHARDQLARHERYLHTPGIADGLALAGTPKKTVANVDYVDVALEAGMAIDPAGREIVVPGEVALSEDVFVQLNVAVEETDPDQPELYPVFLSGSDAAAAPPTLASGACGGSESTRVVEGYDITFGRPGDERETSGEDGSPPRVLLGYVQWNADIKKFRDVALEREGTKPTYAGVRADVVSARSGELLLRGGPSESEKQPAVLITSDKGGELRFGLQNATGQVVPVFTVTSKGDVTAEGVIKATGSPTVYVESGVIFDGMLVPLPQGVSEKQVQDGAVVLHIQVTPRFQDDPNLTPAANELYIPVPIECRVEERRIFCRTRWIPTHAAPLGDVIEVPASCNYTVLAVGKPQAAGGA